MSIIDRSVPPDYKIVENITIPVVEEFKLENGVEVFFTKTMNEDISEFIFVFDGGVWNQKNLLEANSCVKLMSEGTKYRKSSEIAELFDFYGAYFKANADLHFSYFKLMSLNKYLSELLDLVSEILKYPIFDKKEFDLFKNKNKERLTIDFEEVDLIARNELQKMIFGKNHPYGWSAEPADFDKLKLSGLKKYFSQNIFKEKLKIFVTSNNKEKAIELLNKNFNDFQSNKDIILDSVFEIKNSVKEKYIEKPDAMQSAVRLGWRLFERNHEDNMDFMMLNVLLGGYFGSRLMQNIRQKKGFTYSIYSSVNAYKYDGSFEIVSEVNKENKNNVVEEIKKEIINLQKQAPTKEEIENMKNYLSGSLLRSLDGVFTYSRSLVSFVVYQSGFDYFQRYFDRLKTISPERIQQLAIKYLNLDEMFKVVVG